LKRAGVDFDFGDKWKRVRFYSFFVAIILFLIGTMYANFDLAAGRFCLFMDEVIAFDGIRHIQHADNFKDMLHWIVGEDQRYGRVLWYVPALFSWLPEFFWGETGQIIATRMTVALVLLASFLILSIGLIRDRWLSLACLVLLLVVPYGSYYASMPKPEPFLVLFFGLFLVTAARLRRILGWHWIFLGLAFGAKIVTVVTFVPIGLWVAVELVNKARRSAWRATLSLVTSIVCFLVGFFLSVPVVLYRGTGLREYVSWTFLSTGHGSDSSDVTAWSWITHIPPMFGGLPWSVGGAIILLLPLVALIRLALANLWNKDGIKSSWLSWEVIGQFSMSPAGVTALVTACGWMLLLSIVLSVHRLWGFYLFPAFVLLVVGGLMALQQLTVLHKKLSLIALIAIMASVPIWATYRAEEYYNLAHRTSTSDFITATERYQRLVGALQARAVESGRRLRVAVNPGQFIPETNSAFVIEPIWGPFKDWAKEFDLIFLLRQDIEPPSPDIAHSIHARELTQAQKDYPSHMMADKSAGCSQSPCYQQVWLDERLLMLVKVD